MQQFVDILVTNGYDDLHFLAEVSDSELQEIGIRHPTDREKVRVQKITKINDDIFLFFAF